MTSPLLYHEDKWEQLVGNNSGNYSGNSWKVDTKGTLCYLNIIHMLQSVFSLYPLIALIALSRPSRFP